MKRLFMLLPLLAFVFSAHAGERKMIPRYNTITHTWASYPLVTMREIQYVPPESLHVADSLQTTINRASVQWSSYARHNDTVVVVGTVIAPYYTITYTQHGWTMLLCDTGATPYPWGGALVRVGNTGSTPDTAQARLDGFTNFEQGDEVMMTVRVEEFPIPTVSSMNSATQIRPIPGIAMNLVGFGSVPVQPLRNVSDFWIGPYPGGKSNYSVGEQYEDCYVKLTNLTVTQIVNAPRGTWAMTDQNGNNISDYDASYYFTFGSSENPPITPDTSVTHFRLPPIGSVIDSIKGFIIPASGQENARSYRICPLFPGDVAYGVSRPSITQHRRYPVIVTDTDSVRIDATVRKIVGGYDISKAVLLYSLNNGPWQADTMEVIDTVSTYEAILVDQDGNPFPNGTFVKYFIKALDIQGTPGYLANSSSLAGTDTSQGFFFYTVLNRPLTIHDVQYTPYRNGRTPYLGAVTSVSGIVTADTSDIGITALNTGGTNSWYIQDGPGAWNGIWVVARDSISRGQLAAMRRGDSVTVTGTIQENFDVTRISDSLVAIHTSGRPLPAPTTISDSVFAARGSGDPVAEPYEGVLIRMTNLTVSDVNPTFSDLTEWAVSGATNHSTLVRRDGTNSYSNQESDTLLGKTHILHVGDRVDTLIGVGYFSFSRYKIVPRKDDDFVAGNPIPFTAGWNMVSLARRQMPSFWDSVKYLFPRASSRIFGYSGSGYVQTNVVATGKGYWVKYAAPTNEKMLGALTTTDTVAISVGWNMVGALGYPVAANTITAYPAGTHLSSFFGFSGGYLVADTLKPNYGYWVKSDSTGYLVESSASLLPRMGEPGADVNHFNNITVSDKDGNAQKLYFGLDADGKVRLADYEMPPSSPAGSSFDARFSSGRILETYPKFLNSPAHFGININAQSLPVTLTWNIADPSARQITLSDQEDGKVLKTRTLSGTGSVTIAKSGMTRLNISVSGGVNVPREFSLSQNYPNPFNPTTSFVVGLPQASHLEIGVFNVLGQKVATLVNEMRDAGYYTVRWNSTSQEGNSVASGIYFVRMAADKFTAVRKIMLLK